MFGGFGRRRLQRIRGRGKRYSVIVMCQIFRLRERNTSTVAVVLRVTCQTYQADLSIHWSCRDMNVQADR